MTGGKAPPVQVYLRPKKRFPSVWCPGCGIGIVLGGIIRAVESLRLEKDDVALISGIGCSGRLPVYADFNTLHTTHGRALAFATGLKLARPSMKVIVVMGDGDAVAIGGNHFIHAARRNLDLTAIVVNNSVYGMTGGQQSPTTPLEARATTAPYGNIERPIDICRLADAAGAPFVARTTAYHAIEIERLVATAIDRKAFSVVEVLTQCPVYFGRLNQAPTPWEMLRAYRNGTSTGETEGKIRRGILVDRDMPEYWDEYQRVMTLARKASR
jgi:2-oxoglutarate ferredoxin oxidoreductase subunit beta